MARSHTKWLTIWRGPSEEAGKRYAFLTENPVGQDLEFLVEKTARDDEGDPWLRILLPIRPNGAAGWVRMGAVKVHEVTQRIVVDLSDKTLRYYRDGHLEHDFSVGIGRPETPTAVGTFFVWAQVPQASPVGAVRRVRARPLRVLAGAQGLARRRPDGDPRHGARR